MTQQQIKGATGSLGSGGSLDVYDVPGSVILTPYSVSATFDGSGAGGSFLPCLTFKTQTGAVIARCPAPEVASGDTAEVSWFPHVAQAVSAAPSSGLAWAYGANTSTSLPGNGSFVTAQMNGVHFFGGTSDTAVMSFAANGSGDYGISLNAEGIYLFMARFTINPITDLTLKYSGQVRLQPSEADLWDQNLVPFVPDFGGTLAHAYPSITGLYNIGPDSIPAPVVVTAQGAQDSGGALTSSAGLFAYRLNPVDSPDF